MNKALEKYLFERQLRLAHNTLLMRRGQISQFLSYHDKPLNEITSCDAEQWPSFLLDSGNIAPTIRKKIQSLRSFFDFCKEEDWVESNPFYTVPLPKLSETLPNYLTQQELNGLRSLADHPCYRAIVETLYSTGIRISELTQIQLNHIIWEEKQILIFGKGSRQRLVNFNTSCEARLNHYLEWRKSESPYLFINPNTNRPIHQQKIRRLFHSYGKKLGIEFTPHTLRHTFAAHMAKQGMKDRHIQVLLGHENDKDTQIYINLFAHARKRLYDKYE